MREKPFFPNPDHFIGKCKASEQEDLSHIPIAEPVAYTAKQHLKDDVCGDCDKVKERAGALIVGTPWAREREAA